MDGAVLAAAGASAKECAVLRFPDEEAAADAAALLRDLSRRAVRGFHRLYAGGGRDDRVRPGRDARRVLRHGRAAGCGRGHSALRGLLRRAASHGRGRRCNTPPPAASAEPSAGDGGWEYDAERIKAAYFSGDESGLAAEDLAILSAAREILALAPDTLSEYERELIIHDAIVDAARYDEAELSAWPLRLTQPEPNNENPYGALVKGLAVCRGYASSFQLLIGPRRHRVHHRRGHGELRPRAPRWIWCGSTASGYCVDVTWDDPVGSTTSRGYMAHQYFNVTSEFMRDTNHYWDAEGVPRPRPPAGRGRDERRKP